jgi:hypothetical protein
MEISVLQIQKGAAATTPGSGRFQPRRTSTLTTTVSGTAEPPSRGPRHTGLAYVSMDQTSANRRKGR